MSRLEWLQMKRTCASYGPPLTPYEQVELFRLEADHNDGGVHQLTTEHGLTEDVSEPAATIAAIG